MRRGAPATLSAHAGALVACAWPALAFAQAAPTPPSGELVQAVVVTGSRLSRPQPSADVPVLTLGADAVQRSAALTTEVLLNRLPQATPSFSSASNNPSAHGAAFLNLRGLGTQRNLVLLDGRRAIGANASNSVDLNTVPPALIERIEIITGGASAVYGADAVAGVVNVILRDRFDGLELQGRTLVSQRGDGREQQLSLTAGRALGGVHLSAGLGWSRRDGIGKGARDFSAQATDASSFLPTGGWIPGANMASQAAIDTVFARYGVAAGKVSPRGGVAGFGFNGDGTLIATGAPNDPRFDAQNYRGSAGDVAARLYPDVYSYNFQPFNALILPLERVTAAVFADARLSDRLSLYGRVLGAHYSASTALAATAAPGVENPLYPGLGVTGFTIPVSNPFIPADLAQLLASRRGDSPALAGAGATEEFVYRFRSVALGPRQSANRTDSLNLTAGVKAELPAGWRGDAYLSLGEYRRSERQSGLLAIRKVEQLLDSPTGGTEFCAGGFNPFGQGLSKACGDFVGVAAGNRTRVRMANLVASAQGTVIGLPAGPLRAAAGGEYRRVSFGFTPPTGLSAGEVAGFTQYSDLHGSLSSADVFFEAEAPLLADLPLARRVTMTVGARRTQAQGSDPALSFKGELGWEVAGGLRLRGSAQRAVRLPDIFERFEPPAVAGDVAADPCAQASLRSAAVQALCRKQAQAMGFTAAAADGLVQDSLAVNVLHQGNAAVQAEKAATFTLGAVWRPRFSSRWSNGLEASVDGYEIRIRNAIGYRDPQVVLNACYNLDGTSNPSYDLASPACQPIRRSGVNFSLLDIAAPRVNQGLLETSGIDAALSFRTDLAALGGHPWLGRLSTQVVASWLARFTDQPSPAQRRVAYAGTLADANFGYESLPRWKGLADIGWSGGPLSLEVSGRFIGAMSNRILKLDPTAVATGVGPAWYWDLSGRLALGRGAELRAGVLNLFDRPPELYTPSVDTGTEPSTYDVIGRRFWLGLTLRR